MDYKSLDHIGFADSKFICTKDEPLSFSMSKRGQEFLKRILQEQGFCTCREIVEYYRSLDDITTDEESFLVILEIYAKQYDRDIQKHLIFNIGT